MLNSNAGGPRASYFDYLGFDIFYRVDGPPIGEAPVLLAIHGYPFNSWDWSLIWPTLVERFTVIAPDMIGMGFSAKPVAYGYSVHDHADIHEALLEHLNIDQLPRSRARPRRLGRPGTVGTQRVR